MINFECSPVRLLFWGTLIVMAYTVDAISWTVTQPPRFVWRHLRAILYSARQSRAVYPVPAAWVKK